jgi:hypothetical protein
MADLIRASSKGSHLPTPDGIGKVEAPSGRDFGSARAGLAMPRGAGLMAPAPGVQASLDMGHRAFTDSRRVRWEVWDVYPTHAERRAARGDRRRFDRREADRRRTVDPTRIRVSAAYARGWLTFESKHDRRRVAPVPDDWERLSEAELEQLCLRAVSVWPAPAPHRVRRLLRSLFALWRVGSAVGKLGAWNAGRGRSGTWFGSPITSVNRRTSIGTAATTPFGGT